MQTVSTPYWFLGRTIYENVKMHQVFGFIQQVDNLNEAILSGWGYHIATFAMLMADYSLWKIGEPTGRANRYFLLIPFVGAIFHVFTIVFPFPFAPAGTFLNALGMVLVGTISIKSAIWRGWKRFTPLYLGLFPFLVQFPLLFILGTPPYHVLPLWGIPGALLGLAAWQRANEVAQAKNFVDPA